MLNFLSYFALRQSAVRDAATDVANRRWRDWVVSCDDGWSFALSKSTPYLTNLVRRQLALGGTVFARRERVPALAVHVERVVSMRPKKEVIGIDAEAVIATMADDLTFRDRTIDDLPCDTMGSTSVQSPIRLADSDRTVLSPA
jgi:hypothetical protein